LAEDRLRAWEPLFRYALQAIDSVGNAVFTPASWSFGGGTVLMRRYRHRISKDVDIFVPDPQYLGYLSPRHNDTVDALTSRHLEDANYLKLYFSEGEIDFIAAAPVTSMPASVETVLERQVRVETAAEIVAKKVRYRAAEFTARDVLDFALVAERAPEVMTEITSLLREKRDDILERLNSGDRTLRKTFVELEVLEYRRTYDQCVRIVRKVLNQA
jgi:predicted nucleotidyltransferase component of viral defense system